MRSQAAVLRLQAFLQKALMPLHKPKGLGMYQQQLSYCVTQVGLARTCTDLDIEPYRVYSGDISISPICLSLTLIHGSHQAGGCIQYEYYARLHVTCTFRNCRVV